MERRERLQKYLARAGVAARRPAEELIRAGRVTVNGQVADRLGVTVDPDRDVVAVDGRVVRPPAERQYLVLHKPPGYVTTVRDPEGRPTVMELLPRGRRLYPVGRLDADSEGLLLVTDDGDLAYRLLHPRFGVEKEYHVLVDRAPSADELERLRSGVELEEGRTAPAQVAVVATGPNGAWLRVTVHEGRKRQVRRMCQAVGLRVRRLVRTRFGPIMLGRLPVGRYRLLRPEEVRQLRGEVS
jgi:pseudouridine synthase